MHGAGIPAGTRATAPPAVVDRGMNIHASSVMDCEGESCRGFGGIFSARAVRVRGDNGRRDHHVWSSPPFLGGRPKAVAGPSACGPSVTNFCDPTSLFTICRAQVGPGFLFFIRLFGFRVTGVASRVKCTMWSVRSNSMQSILFYRIETMIDI